MIPLDLTTASTSQTGRRITTRSHPRRNRSAQSESARPTRSRASSSSSSSGRRSVSSMKGLMPLALSPSWSSSSSSSLAEERVGNKVDGYFPEILAKDLERSDSVFSSRNMTAGPPEASLSTDKGTLDTRSPWPHRSVSLPYHGASGPVRSLVPIQERNSVVSFLDQHDAAFDDTSSDPESMSGTEFSKGATAPSISLREQSVVTAATSLASSSCWAPSPRNSPPCEVVREHSWIDADTEEEDQEDPNENLSSLSPRPPTPPESDTSTEPNADCQEPTPRKYNSRIHRKSYSISGSAPISPPRRRSSGRHSESTAQRPALIPVTPFAHRPAGRRSSDSTSPPTYRPRASSLQTPRSNPNRSSTSHACSKNEVLGFSSDNRPTTEPVYVDNIDPGTDQDSPVRTASSSSTAKNAVYIQPSPPPSPLPSVQTWLNCSTQPYISQCPGDDLAKAVPLPPDVVETLRVSIACFPETMLLTSSLTVETIRNYSNKVRQPSSDLMTNLAPDSPEDNPRRSIWKRVVSYKRSPPIPERRRPQPPTPSTNANSQNSAAIRHNKPWTPLKNVFGYCSDYICDALWAHIVAYNYVSALVPRTPPQSRSSRGRPSSAAANDSHNEEIPKKAASLLGLAVSQDMGAGVDRVARKLGSQLPWGLKKDGMVTDQSARSATYDNTTKDIQAGLMRCIMRLIATAKLMAEDGTAEDRAVEMETRGVDVLFTRSLCEIVRMAEEPL